MRNKKSVYITKIISSGTAFGVDLENGESVFIGARVTKASSVVEGETYSVIIVPNDVEHADSAKWRGVAVIDLLGDRADAPVANKKPEVDMEAVIRAVLEPGGLWRLFSIASVALGGATGDVTADQLEKVLSHLENLHARGEVAEVCVYRNPDDEEPAITLYTKGIATALEHVK